MGTTTRIRFFVLFVLSAASLELNLPGDLVVGNLVILATSCFIIAAATFTGEINKAAQSTTLVAVFSYMLVCAASALWAPSAFDTLVQSLLLASTLVAIAQLRSVPTAYAISFILKLAVVVAIVSFAIAPLVPGYAFQPHDSGRPELRGIFYHQQRLGNFMCLMVGLGVLAWLNGDLPLLKTARHRRKFVVAMLVVAAGAFAAFARFYILFALLSLLFVLGLGQRGQKRILIMLGLLAAFVVGTIYWNSIEDLLAGGSVDLTFTGRTRVWDRALSIADEAPVLGHGFASFYNSIFDRYFPYYRPGHAHNSFIQAYFETGIVGLTALLAIVGFQFRIGLKAMAHVRTYSYSLYCTTFCFLCGLTGVYYAGKLSLLLCLTFLLSALEAHEVRHTVVGATHTRRFAAQPVPR